MNAHETTAVIIGLTFLFGGGGFFVWYVDWLRRGYRSVRPKQRKEKKP